MTRLEDRRILLRDIAQARSDGARLASACALVGLDPRTLQRWTIGEGVSRGDRRPEADHPIPSHALSEAERARIIAVVNEPRFAETPPARIVPALADGGIYIASEFSFHPEYGLGFDFLANSPDPTGPKVLTGHDNGLITIALEEADDAERERRRTQMGEPYRSLLGHFRHEIGHYYWDVLVRDGGELDACRCWRR